MECSSPATARLAEDQVQSLTELLSLGTGRSPTGLAGGGQRTEISQGPLCSFPTPQGSPGPFLPQSCWEAASRGLPELCSSLGLPPCWGGLLLWGKEAIMTAVTREVSPAAPSPNRKRLAQHKQTGARGGQASIRLGWGGGRQEQEGATLAGREAVERTL